MKKHRQARQAGLAPALAFAPSPALERSYVNEAMNELNDQTHG